MSNHENNGDRWAKRVTTELNRNTLIPLGIVLLLITMTWSLASDRQAVISDVAANATEIERHSQELARLTGKLDYLTSAMVRVESALGTRPKDSHVEGP